MLPGSLDGNELIPGEIYLLSYSGMYRYLMEIERAYKAARIGLALLVLRPTCIQPSFNNYFELGRFSGIL